MPPHLRHHISETLQTVQHSLLGSPIGLKHVLCSEEIDFQQLRTGDQGRKELSEVDVASGSVERTLAPSVEISTVYKDQRRRELRRFDVVRHRSHDPSRELGRIIP